MVASRNNTLAFLIAFLFSYQAFCQEGTLDLNRKIVIKPGTFSLDSIFHITARQTGAVFSYDANRLDVRQRVRIAGGETTLEKIFAMLTDVKGLCVKQLENHIIVSPCGKNSSVVVQRDNSKTRQEIIQSHDPDNEQKPVTKPSPRKGNVDNDAVRNVTNSMVVPIDSAIRSKETVTTRTTAEIPVVSQSSPTLPDSVAKIPKKQAVDKERLQQQKPKPKSKPRQSILFAKTGVSFDESRYAGVLVQAGVPALYAAFAANTNFRVSYIQYGLGTSLQITKKARVLFNFSLGNINRSGHYTDSVKNQYPVRVESNLTRLSAALEFFVSDKIGVQIGPVFNHLKTNYYINNAASNLAAFNSGDEVFSTIRPPYLIVNTYSPTTDSNVKTWVGLQVSVFYHIKL